MAIVKTPDLEVGKCYKSKNMCCIFRLEKINQVYGNPLKLVCFKEQVSVPFKLWNNSFFCDDYEEFEECQESELYKAIKFKKMAESSVRAIIKSKTLTQL